VTDAPKELKTKLKPWTFVSDTETFSTPVFTVLARKVISPKDGKEKDFTVLRAPNWVNILALTPSLEVVMVNQYRHGSREFSLELPGGVTEEGDSLRESAVRELMEETGYSCEKVEKLLTLNPNPAIFGNSITTFLAHGARKTGDVDFDENEETEVSLLTIDKLRELYLSGCFTHALMSAPIGYFLATINKK
jgi:8-oxo-dGTP pyrophosphatase MutT (NUDIX family)